MRAQLALVNGNCCNDSFYMRNAPNPVLPGVEGVPISQLLKFLRRGAIITTSGADGKNGLVSGHVFSVLSAYERDLAEPVRVQLDTTGAVRVLGSGCAAVCGTYEPTGEYNGRPMFECAETGLQLWWNGEYRIGRTNDYYYTSSELLSGWAVCTTAHANPAAVHPPPAVTDILEGAARVLHLKNMTGQGIWWRHYPEDGGWRGGSIDRSCTEYEYAMSGDGGTLEWMYWNAGGPAMYCGIYVTVHT